MPSEWKDTGPRAKRARRKAIKGDTRLLRVAWQASSAAARRRFIDELLAGVSLKSGRPAVRSPAGPGSKSLDDFFSACVVKSLGDRVQSSVLYDRYRRWSLSRGEDPLTQTAFSRRLRERGCAKHMSNFAWWTGIALVDGCR